MRTPTFTVNLATPTVRRAVSTAQNSTSGEVPVEAEVAPGEVQDRAVEAAAVVEAAAGAALGSAEATFVSVYLRY